MIALKLTTLSDEELRQAEADVAAAATQKLTPTQRAEHLKALRLAALERREAR